MAGRRLKRQRGCLLVSNVDIFIRLFGLNHNCYVIGRRPSIRGDVSVLNNFVERPG